MADRLVVIPTTTNVAEALALTFVPGDDLKPCPGARVLWGMLMTTVTQGDQIAWLRKGR